MLASPGIGVSVLEEVLDGGDHAHLLHVRRVLVAVVDGEKALGGRLDLSEFAFGVVGKLLGSFAGVAGGLFNHLGFDGVETGEFILHLRTVVTGRDGDALLEEFAHTRHEGTHLVDIGGRNGDDARDVVAVARGVVGVALGTEVDNLRCTDTDVLLTHAIGDEELADTWIDGIELRIDGREVVARRFVGDGPDDMVGLHLSLGKSAHTDHTVLGGKIRQSKVNAKTQEQGAQGQNEGFNSVVLHKAVSVRNGL